MTLQQSGSTKIEKPAETWKLSLSLVGDHQKARRKRAPTLLSRRDDTKEAQGSQKKCEQKGTGLGREV